MGDLSDQLRDLWERTRVFVLPILAGVILIIVAGLGIVYFQQKQTHTDLNADIARLGAGGPSEELRDSYQEALENTELSIKQEDLIQEILDIAEACGFDISTDSTTLSVVANLASATTQTIGQTNYRVLPVTVTLTGGYDMIMNFVEVMDSMPALDALVVQKVTVQRGESAWTGILTIGIYTR